MLICLHLLIKGHILSAGVEKHPVFQNVNIFLNIATLNMLFPPMMKKGILVSSTPASVNPLLAVHVQTED